MKLPLAAARDQPRGFQRLDVVRDGGLRQREVLDDLRAVHAAQFAKARDHLPPRGVGEGLGDFDEDSVLH
jgi:hypothetical protein